MKKNAITLLILLFSTLAVHSQSKEFTNFISCKVDGKEYKAEARRLNIVTKGMDYLSVASFQVSPDVQVWIRIYYLTETLEPGTYNIISDEDLGKITRKNVGNSKIWVLLDYTEETKSLGHGFHDGESLSGTLTIDKTSKTSVEGSFEATLTGVYYQKKAIATLTGSGIKGNIQKKMVSKAGGGMIVNAGIHDHANTKKLKETDTIVLTDGRFFIDWNKKEKE